MRESLKSYIGTAGMALLFVAAIAYRLRPEWKLYCMIGAGVGLAFTIGYVVLNFRDVKNALSGRTTLYSANTALAIAMVLAIVGMLNFLSARHHKRWDITEGKIHSLSDQSIKVLRNLEKTGRKVEVNAFFQEGDAPEAKMRDLLSMYQAETRQLKVQFFDPAKNPGLAKRFNIDEYNTTVLTSAERETKIKGLGEEDFTNALIQVSRDTHKTVYFLQGHGETDIDSKDQLGLSQAKENLEKENYIVKKLPLATASAFPADCSVLVIAGPQAGVTPDEQRVIEGYLEAGGRALVMLDPGSPSGLESFLQPWGVKLADDVIVDLNPRVIGGDPRMVFVDRYEEHALTKKFDFYTVFPLARSVDTTPQNDHGATPTVIARSSEESWAETDKKAVKYDEGQDTRGPIPVMVAITSEGKSSSSSTESTDATKKLDVKPPQVRMVVVGNSAYPDNAYAHYFGNMNFFLNTIAWLAEEEDLISIRPSTQAPKTISLTRDQSMTVLWSSLVFLPAVVLIGGVAVWARRRNK